MQEFLMRIRIHIFLIILLLPLSTVNLNSASAAATEGCPNTWKIDSVTSLSAVQGSANQINLYVELTEIQKQKGAGNMVITRLPGLIKKHDGALGSISENNLVTYKGGPAENSIFSYLYGKSVVESSYKVEVRGCEPFTFTSLTQLNLMPGIGFTFVAASEWARINSALFRNFKDEEAFPSGLSKLTEFLRNKAAAIIKNPNNSPVVYLNTYGNAAGLPITTPIATVPLTPNCVKRYKDNYYTLTTGQICEFAFAIGSVGSGPSQSQYLVERFTVDMRIIMKTIQCVKGKLTKTYTGVSPRCPGGYVLSKK